jgi:Mo-nitrogenase MoFe protein subunit NifK (EC 1.18.6.1)
LSETIGDDLPTIISQTEIPEGRYVIHANTPSYVGSHITGFSNMVKGFISYLAEGNGARNGKLNIIPGFISPGDIREIKSILNKMNIPFIMLPDTSGVVDAPMTGKFEMYPKGGTTIDEIKDMGNSEYTLALGHFSSEAGAAALDKKFNVPMKVLKVPIGLEATDKFIMELIRLTGREVPAEIEEERGQLVDLMLDAHQYLYGKNVAIAGDPDTVTSLVEFVISLGMTPKYVVTGTPGDRFMKEINLMLEAAGIDKCIVRSECDLFMLHQWLKNETMDLLIGNTHCKYIARAEDIPFVRFGFPILDRYAHQYLPTTGYKGAIRLVESITNALLDRIDRDSAEEDFELVM